MLDHAPATPHGSGIETLGRVKRSRFTALGECSGPGKIPTNPREFAFRLAAKNGCRSERLI
jgi:hypothetical protein